MVFHVLSKDSSYNFNTPACNASGSQTFQERSLKIGTSSLALKTSDLWHPILLYTTKTECFNISNILNSIYCFGCRFPDLDAGRKYVEKKVEYQYTKSKFVGK